MSSIVGCPRGGGCPDNPSATEGETGKPGPSPAVADARWRPRITSDYWRPFFYLLEAAGLAVQLVNESPRRVRRLDLLGECPVWDEQRRTTRVS